jgi:hypothetical protein
MDPNSVPKPIKDLGKVTLSKAADKFVDFVITKYTGKSIKVFQAEGEVEADKVKSRWEELEKPLWLQAEAIKMSRQYSNLGKVLAHASKYVQVEENKITEENDFFWGLTEHSKEISSEAMQNLLGKIMAGEYNIPGTYSMSTLQIIKSLSKIDLELFAFFGSFCLPEFGFLKDFFTMDKNAIEARIKLKIDYSNFLELQNLGLIQAGDYTVSIDIKEGSYFDIILPGYKKTLKIKATREYKSWNFPSCHGLTAAGKEILQHLKINSQEIFKEWLTNFLKEKGLEVIS